MSAWSLGVRGRVSSGFFLCFLVLGFDAGPLLFACFACVAVFDLLLLGGNAGPNGEAEVCEEYGENSARAGESSFGLRAVMHVLGVEGDGAGFGDVPGWAVLRVLRVGGIGGGLVVD